MGLHVNANIRGIHRFGRWRQIKAEGEVLRFIFLERHIHFVLREGLTRALVNEMDNYRHLPAAWALILHDCFYLERLIRAFRGRLGIEALQHRLWPEEAACSQKCGKE